MTRSLEGSKVARVEDSEPEFLRWLARWLDMIDPILQAVFAKASGSVYTGNQRQAVIDWLEGSEVQERLRALADRLTTEAAEPLTPSPGCSTRSGGEQ